MAQQKIGVNKLVINDKAQRELSLIHVKKIADHFKPELLGVIHVSPAEDGKFYVLDGQHRVQATRMINAEMDLVCEVHEEMDVHEQANRFLELNDTLQVRSSDRFKVRVTRGDKDALATYEAITAAGFTTGTGPNGISATRTAEQIVREHGPETLTKGLKVLYDAFGNDRMALSNVFLKAMCDIVSRDSIDDERLVRQMGRVTPVLLRKIADAERGRNVDIGVVGSLKTAILMTYQGQLSMV